MYIESRVLQHEPPLLWLPVQNHRPNIGLKTAYSIVEPLRLARPTRVDEGVKTMAPPARQHLNYSIHREMHEPPIPSGQGLHT